MSFIAPLALLFGLLSVPVIIMYFLKRKRRKVIVSSTWLWMRSLEDLRVNAPFQKLRKSLLLLLQLLLIALITLALARPLLKEPPVSNRAQVLVIDRSASMAATDVGENRLEAAKKAARDLIDGLDAGDPVMVIAFSNRAEVVTPFTVDHGKAERAVDGLQPAATTTRVREALQMAVSSARQFGSPEIYVLSDGNFEAVRVQTEEIPILYVPIGDEIQNVAVTAVDVRKPAALGDPWSVFVFVERYGSEAVEFPLELSVNGDLAQVRNVRLGGDAPEGTAVIFELTGLVPDLVHVRADVEDHLLLDNDAWFVVRRESPEVLVVTPGNFFLEQALASDPTLQVSRMQLAALDKADLEEYDVVIFDGGAPDFLTERDLGRYLFLDCLPPWEGFADQGEVDAPVLVDWDRRHPVTRMIDFSGVALRKANQVKIPGYAVPLVEMAESPLIFLWQKGEIRAVTVTFDILESNWPLRLSFPLFVSNAVGWLRREGGDDWKTHKAPGDPIQVRLGAEEKEVRVTPPSGTAFTVAGEPGEEVVVAETAEAGIYLVQHGETVERFALNLLDPVESSGRVIPELTIGDDSVKGQDAPPPPPKELWFWLGWAAFLVLCLEWLVYHRRVG